MAKFRYSVSSKDVLKFTHKNGDNLRDILKDALAYKKIDYKPEIEDYFKILVDGYTIDKDFWDTTKPSEGQDVVIVAIAKGDDFGAILGVFLIVVASVITMNPGLASFIGIGSGVATASFQIGAALLLGALIQPPDEQIGGGGGSYEESQMFTITSQSNSIKKYGSVPRVYGTHRIFPLIAATPYTELENDPVTGELVQFYYAVYDFGFGPLDIKDLKIGETLIENYNFVDYRLVDFNRPAVDEGVWDNGVFNTLEYYKGDVSVSDVGVALNKNKTDGGTTPDQYEAIRTAALNINDKDQEITVTLACPQGLIAYASNGSRFTRDIELNIQFAEEGTEDWRDFDDKDFVYDYNDPYDAKIIKLVGTTLYSNPGNNIFSSQENTVNIQNNQDYDHWANSNGLDSDWFEADGSDFVYKQFTWNLVNNGNSWIKFTSLLPVGTGVKINGIYVGKVAQNDGVNNHRLDKTINIPLYTEYMKYDVNNSSTTKEYYYKEFKGYGTTGLPYPDFDIDARVSTIKSNSFQSGNTKISAAKTSPVYGVYKFTPITKNQIKVRVTRNSSTSILAHEVRDSLTWTTLQTRFDDEPIQTTQRHTFLELKIKATDQINGSIQNLSAIATSYLDAYDGTSWNLELTNNPAWIYADLLTGKANKRAVDKSRLDTDSLVEWAAYCAEIPTAPASYGTYIKSRFEVNFVLDYATTLSRTLNQVGAAAQASLNMINGKYGVLIDKEKTIPVQIFTPRNSSGFTTTRNYTELPDAIKIKYVDPGSNWELKERVVYNDGFDLSTALTFDEMDTFGCTNNEQAWRFGRYNYAQATLRQEKFRLSVDFEHLVCTRGDYVIITQDSMKIGGIPARVKSVFGTTVTIDDEVVTQGGVNYGYTSRNSVGVISTSTLTVVDPITFVLDGTVPEVGDLFIFGEVDKITFECIVKSIIPSDDLSAELELVEKNNLIFQAESLGTLPSYDPAISEILDINLTAPSPITDLSVFNNGYDCSGRSYVFFIDLLWTPSLGNIYESFEIYVNRGSGYRLADFTTDSTYRYVVDESYLDIEHSFKVLAVNSRGFKIPLGEAISVEATPINKTTAPSDVDGLFINILNETLQLDWSAPTDCDIDSYLVRFSPQNNARWDNSVPILSIDRNNTQTTTPARTGTYLIKARDFNGNESVNAAVAITSIPELVNLNIVDETNDFPLFPGSLDRVVSVADALLLEEETVGGVGVVEYYSEGNYYYDSFLDLGEIYTVRLQSAIEAEGYSKDDLMSNWSDLSSLTAMSITDASEWGVESYYRGTDSFNVMADWATLESINSLSEGAPDAWTPWRKFIQGDFTARIFQFRLKLISNKASVTPRVFDAKIKSDMPDRVESGDNLTIPITGSTISYPLAFKGPSTTPNLQVTIDNAQLGDYAVLTNKTLADFDIIIRDVNGNPVSRQIDYMAKGYGRKQAATI